MTHDVEARGPDRVHWSALAVTLADGVVRPLTVELIADHWPAITWYARTDNLRGWRGAQVRRVGEVPGVGTPRCQVDWAGLKVQASALVAKRRRSP